MVGSRNAEPLAMRRQSKVGAVFGVAAAMAALMTGAMGERDARACGGCFGPPPPPNPPPESVSIVTDHRMILSISPQQTTLYDQIHYTGSPASFAWVLPIAGQVQIGLSSDLVFATLDRMTQTIVEAPAPPACPAPPFRNCPSRNSGAASGGADGSASFADSGGGSSDAGPPPVTVTHEETVGPYETVQLHSTDAAALETWLAGHGYAIPDDVKPIVAAYVAEHFDFLAMKLVPGAGVKSMRPVRVTSAGASPLLPLRMVAAGTGATVGISLWIVAEGRYEPQNFPFFTIGADELTWDYATESSNYSSLRKQKETVTGGRGWQVESASPLSRAQLESTVLRGGGGGGGGGGSPYYDAGADYPGAPATDAGPAVTPEAERQADLGALFSGISAPHVTRLRSDLSHAALATDLVLQASADQSSISPLVFVTRTINVPACPTYPDPPACPPDDGSQRGVDGEGPSHGESFSCIASSGHDASPFTLGSLGVLAGLAIFRVRRRR